MIVLQECLQALLFVSQISLGFIQGGFRNPQHPSRQDPTLLPLAFKELIKIVVSLVLLWRQNIRRARKAGTTSHAANWKGESHVLPLRNLTRYPSDGLDSDEVIFDAESSHNSGLSDSTMNETDFGTNYYDAEAFDQPEWPTRQHMCVVSMLAGLYVVHQSVVSRHPPFTMAAALISI